MNRLFSFLLAGLATGLPAGLFGQDTQEPEEKKIIPLTPNAASLGNYGNLPVSLYTGQPQVSIPLYQIVTSDFTLPISPILQLFRISPGRVPRLHRNGLDLNCQRGHQPASEGPGRRK